MGASISHSFIFQLGTFFCAVLHIAVIQVLEFLARRLKKAEKVKNKDQELLDVTDPGEHFQIKCVGVYFKVQLSAKAKGISSISKPVLPGLNNQVIP